MGLIDIGIVLCFLLVTLGVGLYYGKGVKNIRDYALGGRNFNTATLAATIIATWIAGSDFIVVITHAYMDGNRLFLSTIGDALNFLIVGYIFVPRMIKFLKNLTVAEVMGDIYGPSVKYITSITGIIVSIGWIAMQFHIISSILVHLKIFSTETSLIATAFILISYSVFGGIRSVAITDVVQFISFIIVIFSIGIAIWKSGNFYSNQEYYNAAYNHLLYSTNKSGTDYFTLFVFALIPTLNPAMFQRILIAKNLNQATRAFKISAFVWLIFSLLCLFVGVMLYGYNPNIPYDNIFVYTITEFSFVGLKGFIFVAISAMAMSTVDSHLNASSVIFSHDIFSKLISKNYNELLVSRIFTLVIGISAVVMSLYFSNMIELMLFANNFYMPVVTVPLILAILGFRSSTKSVLIGMGAGFGTVIFWKLILQELTGFDSLIPGMIANLVFFLGSHYLFCSFRGWNDIEDKSILDQISLKRRKNFLATKNYFYSIFKALTTFNLNLYGIRINSSPYSYLMLGILIICSYVTITISSDPVVSEQNFLIIQFLSLGIGGLLVTYFLWHQYLSEDQKESLGLICIIFLLFSSSFMMFIHGFVNSSVVTFVINIIVSSMIISVMEILGIGVLSVILSWSYYSYVYGDIVLSPDSSGTLSLVYGVFALSVIIFTFLKGKEDRILLLENSERVLNNMNKTLNSQIELREEKLKKSMEMQWEIIRNVNHEIKTPMSVLMSNADLLEEAWDNPKMKSNMKDIVSGIVTSIRRFYDYASGLVDLSQFSRDKMLFDIKQNNLKKLLEDSMRGYDNVSLNYFSDVAERMDFDNLKIGRCIRNLLDNANIYSDSQDIEICVRSSKEEIRFDDKYYKSLEIRLTDLGVGIPEEELEKIFEPFYISSRTKKISGGKGLGLALCKEIINMHNGRIWAENNDRGGSSIVIILPIKHPSAKFLGEMRGESGLDEVVDLRLLISKVMQIDEKFAGRMPKILMVDDERMVLQSGEMLIKALGYEFKGINNGKEAIEYINSGGFDADLVLLDMMLCDMSGVDVMNGIKEKLDKEKIRIIIQSGLSDSDSNISRAKELGAKDFLCKPYNRITLDICIKKALGIVD